MGKAWSTILAAVSLVALLAPLNGAQVQAAETRLNVLLIVTDDQPANRLNRFLPKTMRWLRDNGTTFPNAYASTPLCCPSRASIMSGRYAHNHGVKSNGSSEEPGAAAFDHSTSVQRYLQDAGYRTGLVGKLLNGFPVENTPPFWDWFAMTSGGHRNRPWNINGDYRESVSIYNARMVANQSARFIRTSESNDVRPWMLYVTPYAPHVPYDPQRKYEDAPVGSWSGNPAVFEKNKSDKPPWLQEYDCNLRCGRSNRTGQARLIMSVDDLVQRLRDQLSAYDEANTLVVYVSDNGLLWGEHGLHGKAQPYPQASRVPLLMRWPSRVDPGTVDERFALNIDIAPTILEAAGIPVETTVMDGRSLLVDSARNRVHLENWCSDLQERSTNGCDRWASTVTHEYQYIERYNAEGNVIFREYYDSVADPWQLKNLVEDSDPNTPDPVHLAVVAAQLEPDKSCVGGTCP